MEAQRRALLSALERIVDCGVRLGSWWDKLDAGVKEQILRLLDERGVKKIACTSKELYRIVNDAEILKYLGNPTLKHSFEELSTDEAYVYVIFTHKSAIRRVHCYDISVCERAFNEDERRGYVFLRSGKWILVLERTKAHFNDELLCYHGDFLRTTIYMIDNVQNLKTALLDESRESVFDEFDTPMSESPDLVDDLEANLDDTEMKRWLDNESEWGSRLLFRKDYNWNFNLADNFDIENMKFTCFSGTLRFKPSSKIDVWYSISVNVDSRRWKLEGYAQNMSYEEFKQISEPDSILKWMSLDGHLYFALCHAKPTLEWTYKAE